MVKFTIYLDTSSWNHLLGGHMSSLEKIIRKSETSIPCYSTQTIEELFGTSDKTKRNELDVQLDEVGARFLETISDPVGSMPTDFRITIKNRGERRQIHEDMQSFSSVGGFALGDLLQKFIGGIGSASIEDISQKALTDIERLLDFDVSELPPEFAAIVKSKAEAMVGQARTGLNDLLQQVSKEDGVQLSQLDPAHINNFTGVGAVERIIEVAKQHDGTSDFVEKFLEGPPCIPSNRADAHLVDPSWEKVHRLTQLLFLLGYRREAKHRKDTERARIDFSGGQADICHIANASFCSVFHTSDRPQAYLASAVYDHLKVPTVVLLYTPKTNGETMLHTPEGLQAIHE
jgi:hypothetical protein